MTKTNTRKLPKRRIVVKVGTSLLTGGQDQLDVNMVGSIVNQIADLINEGIQMILVTSGAVAAGRGVIRSFSGVRGNGEVSLPDRQVLAAVGQGKLMQVYGQKFSSKDIPVAQALVSKRDVNDRLGYLNLRNTLSALLDRGIVPIVNENDVVSVEELEGEVFGDNDNLSALVANLIDADLLVILGEVSGMYTKDPNLHIDAEIVPIVERIDDYIDSLGGPSSDKMGRGGMSTKIEAARLATASGVDVVIASGLEENVIERLAFDEAVGTLFRASVTKLESRKRWMLSGITGGVTRRSIHVDQGAFMALKELNKSLLPAGVISVSGNFNRGDIVVIVDEQGSTVGAGITNYGCRDLGKIKMARSDRISEILGYHYSDEVIHRDNLVLLVE
jgi:glutamate 5-kinase